MPATPTSEPWSCLYHENWRLTSSSHSYLKLPLIPVEQFLEEFPDHANDDENALMVARIAHERAQRETLEQQRSELVKRKQKLIAENKRRKDDLANLDKDLEKFIDVRPRNDSSQHVFVLLTFSSSRPPSPSRPSSKSLSENGERSPYPMRLCFARHRLVAKTWILVGAHAMAQPTNTQHA